MSEACLDNFICETKYRQILRTRDGWSKVTKNYPSGAAFQMAVLDTPAFSAGISMETSIETVGPLSYRRVVFVRKKTHTVFKDGVRHITEIYVEQ